MERYLTPDPAGLFAGLNSYAYGFNNPLYWVDPWGLWSTPAHNYLIRKYGERHGLTAAQMQAMRRGSAFADSIPAGHQGAKFSFIHAMRSNAIRNKAEACRLANKFINQHLGKHNDLLSGALTLDIGGHRGRNLRNTLYNPYFQLGMAMHTVMDSTSPAHQGFQFWELSQRSRHGGRNFIGDIFGFGSNTQEDLNALISNPALVSRTLSLMNDVSNGGTLDCGCIQ